MIHILISAVFALTLYASNAQAVWSHTHNADIPTGCSWSWTHNATVCP